MKGCKCGKKLSKYGTSGMIRLGRGVPQGSVLDTCAFGPWGAMQVLLGTYNKPHHTMKNKYSKTKNNDIITGSEIISHGIFQMCILL